MEWGHFRKWLCLLQCKNFSSWWSAIPFEKKAFSPFNIIFERKHMYKTIDIFQSFNLFLESSKISLDNLINNLGKLIYTLTIFVRNMWCPWGSTPSPPSLTCVSWLTEPNWIQQLGSATNCSTGTREDHWPPSPSMLVPNDQSTSATFLPGNPRACDGCMQLIPSHGKLFKEEQLARSSRRSNSATLTTRILPFVDSWRGFRCLLLFLTHILHCETETWHMDNVFLKAFLESICPFFFVPR